LQAQFPLASAVMVDNDEARKTATAPTGNR